MDYSDLLDLLDLFDLFDRDQRRVIVFDEMRREVTAQVVRHVDTSAFGEGMITHSRLDEGNADAVISEQTDYFRSINQDFEWKVYSYDRPADLTARLQAHGFVLEDAEAVVVLDLQEAPAVLWEPLSRDVRRITTLEGLADVQAIEEQVWGEDAGWVLDLLGNALRHYPQRMSVYAAYMDSQPVSAAWVYYPQGSQFGILLGGATLINYRGRGLYTALLAARAQEARSREVRFLTVDAMPMSRPILEKHGFTLLAWTTPCKWHSGA